MLRLILYSLREEVLINILGIFWDFLNSWIWLCGIMFCRIFLSSIIYFISVKIVKSFSIFIDYLC